jgi:ABC-type sugar transport system ATPase subunit
LAYDRILTGARVIDPEQGINGVVDVACSGGKVAAVVASLPVGAYTDLRRPTGTIGAPGLRPEDALPERSRGGRLTGVVSLISPLGSEQHVNVATGASEIIVRFGKSEKVAIGDTIDLNVEPARLHVFDHASGQSLAKVRP